MASCAVHPQRAFEWISEIDSCSRWEDLEDSGRFESLDIKISAGLSKILHGEFQRQINVLKEQASKNNKMMNGRHIAWLIYDYCKLTETEGAILEFGPARSRT